MEHKVYKIVEKKGQVFGLPLMDFALCVVYFLTFIIIVIVGGMFFKLSPKLYLVNLFSTIGLIMFLKYLNRKKHPSFLFSFISYKFLQPKQLTLTEPKNEKHKKTKFATRI